jgi:hypothetical protein
MGDVVMVNKPDKPTPVVVEQIPSHERGWSAIASAGAPVIYVDSIPTFGYYNGIAHMTLGVIRFMPGPQTVVSDSMVVGHLRMNMAALRDLKATIEKIELLAKPVPEGAKN